MKNFRHTLAILTFVVFVCRYGRLEAASNWTAWRGGGGNVYADLPSTLPDEAKPLWQQSLSGKAYSGVVTLDGLVIVADHDKDKEDIIHCYMADTGKEKWTYRYANTGPAISYGSCPRATPVINVVTRGVYFLGARGKLVALTLDGRLVWSKDLVKDFNGQLPQWGYCSSPLLAGGRLIVNPGGEKASVVALDFSGGKVVWSSPGAAPNYGSFTVARIGGIEQVIGFDQKELIGRASSDGQVLWRKPLGEFNQGGFLTSSPLVFGDKLIQCAKRGMYLLAPTETGKFPGEWPAPSNDLVVGDTTPTIVGNVMLASSDRGGLAALDLNNGLKELWKCGDAEIGDFANIIAGKDRALVLDSAGELFLVGFDREKGKIIGHMKACGPTMAPPALSGGRIYVRDEKAVYCYALPKGGGEIVLARETGRSSTGPSKSQDFRPAPDVLITSWLVCAPIYGDDEVLPKRLLGDPGSELPTLPCNTGTDYLRGIGGETKARIDSETAFDWNGKSYRFEAQDVEAPVEFPKSMKPGDDDANEAPRALKLATGTHYAACWIQSDKEQEAWLHLGCTALASAWLEGQPILYRFTSGGTRSFGSWPIHLQKGRNTLLVKVDGAGLLYAKVVTLRPENAPTLDKTQLGHADFYPTAERPVGFLGDFTGRFPAAEPVSYWEDIPDGLGKNIVWKTPMPSWSNSSPIVVGERVFTCAEPHTLICADAKSGKILWQHDNDPLELLPPAQAEACRQKWQELNGMFTGYKLNTAEMAYLKGDASPLRWAECGVCWSASTASYSHAWGNKLFSGAPYADADQVQKRLTELQQVRQKEEMAGGPGSFTWGQYYFLPKGEKHKRFVTLLGELAADCGINVESWPGFIGQTFATPTSDGKRVYVTFGWSQAACYELDGRRVWFKRLPVPAPPRTDEPAFNKFSGGYAYENMSCCASPRLIGDKLIVQTGYCLRALDKNTGEVLWEQAYAHANTEYLEWGGPAYIKVGDQELLIATHRRIYRLSDGKIMSLTGDGAEVFEKNASIPELYAIDGTRFYVNSFPGYTSTSIPRAFELSLGGPDTVNVHCVWDNYANPIKRFRSYRAPLLVDGALYVPECIESQIVLDAKDGSVVTDIRGGAGVTVAGDTYGPLPVTAGPYVFLLRSPGLAPVFRRGADFQLLNTCFFDSPFWRTVWERKLPFEEIKKQFLDRDIYHWPDNPGGNPFFQGRNMYIRTHEFLYCIGPK